MKSAPTILAALVLAASLAPVAAVARAGTLLRCDGVATQQGYKYVGTYCVDSPCSYPPPRMFDSYCPSSL